MDEVEEDSDSDDGPDDDDEHTIREGGKSSGEDNEVDFLLDDFRLCDVDNSQEPGLDEDTDSQSEDDEEHIIVTRQEDQRDPELDADFDRELAKMMADSIDSRKLERKALFDVPLPMRRGAIQRDPLMEDHAPTEPQSSANPPGMMKFSLLSKRGNRAQA
jgi:regulator of nonsense transcripts 2